MPSTEMRPSSVTSAVTVLPCWVGRMPRMMLPAGTFPDATNSDRVTVCVGPLAVSVLCSETE